MAEPKKPAVWVELILEAYPVGVTTTYRWSTRPVAKLAAGFIEGRLDSIGEVRRALSDRLGSYDVASSSIVVRDDDGLLRTLLAEDQPTRWFSNREIAIKLLSEAGLDAALTPRPLLRGVLTDVQLQDHRKVQVDLVDRLEPYLDRELPQATFERVYPGGVAGFPDINQNLVGTPIPLIGGEHSDGGMLDQAGNNVSKGIVPAIGVGQRTTTGLQEFTSPSFVAPPTLSGSAVGGASVTSYFYSVTALNQYGETVASNIVTLPNAYPLSTTNYNVLTWNAPTGATHYAVYGRTNAIPVRRLSVQVATTFTDIGVAPESTGAPPLVNTAQIALTEGGFFWDFYVVALGVVEIKQIFASDLGSPPKRIYITEDNIGVTFLHPTIPHVPGTEPWPHPNPWVDIGGMRLTGFYARGPQSYQHMQGIVTMACNVCGYEDVGDGSGNSLQEAFPLLQHFLNEFVLKNAGDGYRTGNWGPLQTWTDSAVPVLWTSKFTDAQTLTKTRLGNSTGYTAGIYVREKITVRDFLQRFCQTFDCFLAINHHGQIFPVLMDDLADPALGMSYKERIEIVDLPAPTIDNTVIENQIVYQYDWNPDAGAFRNEPEKIKDDASIAALRGKVQEGTIQQYYTRDAGSARDAMARRLIRMKQAMRTQQIVTNYTGLETEIGDQILVTHRDGFGPNGYVNTPFLVIEHITDHGEGRGQGRVTLTGYDLSRIVGTVEVPVVFPGTPAPGNPPDLVDETGMVGNLGDETLSASPPTGAFELR